MQFGTRRKRVLVLVLLLALLTSIGFAAYLLIWRGDEVGSAAPPRADDAIAFPNELSHIALDLRADLGALERALEREVPRKLWEINEPDTECVAPEKIDLALFKVKTPRIKCNIVGTVTRGRLRLSGRARNLIVTMPINAEVAARDIAGIFSNESGSAAANANLTIRLDLTPEWQLVSNPQLDYEWTEEPGIEFLGRRITFTSTADRELEKVRGEVKKIITRELANVGVREAAEEGWREAHAVIELNRENPAVWARLTPQQVRYGGYSVEGRQIILRLGLDAQLETFVGIKPKSETPSPLPRLATRAAADTRSVLHVPVIADYAVLEPVIARALARRSERPFLIEDYGSVTASFDNITVYGTPPGRIAVGADFIATSDMPMVGSAMGRIWLAARPVNEPNSREVEFSNTTVSGDTNLVSQPLLFALANSLEFQGTISDALRQNFENDFNELRGKIEAAVARRQDGPLDYSVTIETIETGVINAHGQGLYLPVELTARASGRLVWIR
jgi:hypothetical protein